MFTWVKNYISKYLVTGLVVLLVSTVGLGAYYKRSYGNLILTYQSSQEQLKGSLRALEECSASKEVSLKALNTLCIENVVITDIVTKAKSEVSKEFDKEFTKQFAKIPSTRMGVLDIDENKDIVTNNHPMLPDTIDKLLKDSYDKIYLRESTK